MPPLAACRSRIFSIGSRNVASVDNLSIELPFLFGNLKTWKKAAMLAGAGDEELSSLRRDFQRAIISFVVNGDPATGSQVEWPGFERGGPLLHFGRSIEKSAGVSHADR